MEFLNSRINRRTFGGITIGAAASASFAGLVSAQDATPEVDESMEATPAGAPTLAELENVPQVEVIANNNSYAIFQAGENVPGWYVFNLVNESEADAAFNLARLPEDVAVSDFTSFLFQLTSGQLTELPEWLMDVTFAGGTYAPVGETTSALVNLGAGEWVAFSDLAVSTQNVTTIQVSEPVAEEGEAGATPEVAEAAPLVAPEGFGSTFTVSIADGAINADSSPAVGYNIIGVRNDASMAANFVLIHSDEAVEDAAAADLAAAWLAGEESGAHVDGGMGVISSGAYGYIELEAEAGTYVGFSSVVNASGGSQLEDGAVIVFNVG